MRSFYVLSVVVLLVAMFQGCSGCTEQHRPEGHWNKMKSERELANTKVGGLNDDGTLKAGGEEEKVDVATLYTNFCASCHGAAGKGDGPAGMALNPKPRNLTDVAWHDEVDDQRIYTVIEKGGTAVGLSATMAPWGGILKKDQITEMVEYVRSLKGT